MSISIMTKAVFKRAEHYGEEAQLIKAEYKDVPEEAVRQALVEDACDRAGTEDGALIREAYAACHGGVI